MKETMMQRIKRMEYLFDYVQKNDFMDASTEGMIQELREYQESGQWLMDYEADERGELPAELKRSVLSQDGLFDFLCKVDELKK